MKILAFESSAKAASTALLSDGLLLAEYTQNSGQTHSRTLMQMAKDMLTSCDLTPQDIGAVAVAAGPGSFTGVRIGMACAKGFAWGLQLPLYGVSTLEAMTRGAAYADGLYCACMDARKQQIYNAVFSLQAGKLTRLTDDRAIAIDALVPELSEGAGPIYLLGDGAKLVSDTLAGSGLPEDRMTPRERELCREDMNHDFLTGVFNRRYFETEFCTRLDEWADQHRCASLALVALDNADALRAGYGPVVMSQLVCFVANQWKKHFDRPAERVVCRLADSLFVIGCADKNCKELEEELHTLYGQMPHECVASVGLMKMVPIPQSIAVACTSEVRGRNWEAVFQLCRQRLEAVQQAGGDQVSQS